MIVGMTGLAGAGKDAAADRLVSEFGFIKRSFAEPLKKVLLIQNPIIGADHFTTRPIQLRDAIERYGEAGVKMVYPEYRRLLQRLGTEGIRAIDPDFWVKAALADAMDESLKYVFTDVRFPNEAKAIEEMGGVLCHVQRPNAPSPTMDTHSSEEWAGRLGEHYAIINNQGLDELAALVDDVVFGIYGKAVA